MFLSLLVSLNTFYLHKSCKWDWTQVITTLVKISLLQKCKQKMITHNGDSYTNKLYYMIYLDDNNKVSMKNYKVK